MKHTVFILILFICLIQAEEKTATEKQESQKDTISGEKKHENPLTLERYFANIPEDFIYGYCIMMPNAGMKNMKQFVYGGVSFKQSLLGGATEIRVNVTGFNTEDKYALHGLHIHEYGDLSNGCQSTGSHYNPFGVAHGAPEDSPEYRHFGDLGSIREGTSGEVDSQFKDYLVSLLGPFSILGRSVVIHGQEDDLGRGKNKDSLKTGNAGDRIACCTIGLATSSSW